MNVEQINNTNLRGAKVQGTYCGVAISGTIVDDRPCYGQDMQYTIKLDQLVYPFNNMDDPRDMLLLDGRDLESYDISNY